MSFAMFVTWALVGVLAGVLADLVMKRGGFGLKRDITLGLVGSIGASWIFRAVGVVPEAGMVLMAVVASIGAAIPIVVQRKIWPTERLADEKGAMWRWGLGAGLAALVGWMILGPSSQPAATAAMIEDKSYTVTPETVTVKTGVVAGEVVRMRIMERVERGSDRVVSAAKLSGTLWLKNTSANQSVRMVAGKIQYLDAQGQGIPLEQARSEPTFKFGADGGVGQLDPGQEGTQSLEVEFPAEALKAKKLKEIRLELAYVASPYRAETVNFAVSIDADK
jgi:uncharacterized membrane protein YeaQ/YmgE (transglycosylase-associated protein family)